MVEMYLYPELEMLWAQAEQGEQKPLQASVEAVTAAQKLLNDVHVTNQNMLQHQVLPGVIHINYDAAKCAECSP